MKQNEDKSRVYFKTPVKIWDVCLPDVRENNSIQVWSAKQVAVILTLPGIQAPCLNMRHIQMSSIASELIVNPIQRKFRGHGMLT